MPKNKDKQENKTYAQVFDYDKSTGPSITLTDKQFQELRGPQSPYGNAFGSGSSSGSGSTFGLDLGKKYIKDITKKDTQFKKEDLPDLFNTLTNQLSRGAISPDLAYQNYLNAARYAGVKKPFSTAEKLATMEQGFVDPKKYERYTPFFQLNAEQLLGRTLSENEIKNYTEAFRGMGISKPADVSAAFGNMLLSTPEARSREVVVSKGLFDRKPNLNLMA
jgi:hypothetical protein